MNKCLMQNKTGHIMSLHSRSTYLDLEEKQVEILHIPGVFFLDHSEQGFKLRFDV